MIETLFSLLGGGMLRVVPEILGFMSKKDDNSHELAMLKFQVELESLKSAGRQAEIAIQGEVDQMLAALKAQGDALAGQMKQTGIWWVDALNTLVRPLTTYWFLFLYSVVKISTIIAAWGEAGVWTAIIASWTKDDMAILSGILSFWFVGRVFDKKR